MTSAWCIDHQKIGQLFRSQRSDVVAHEGEALLPTRADQRSPAK
jgi:hypothetical protein